VSTLADLLHERTDLQGADVEWLHRLVGEWQLVSDLGFADLVLWVRGRDGQWLAAAHMRPTTGPTAYADDVVGTVHAPARAWRLERAWREGRLVRDSEPDRSGPVPLMRETVPVGRAGRTVAVLSRDCYASIGRSPSALELTYISSASELLQMVAEGTFPYPGDPSDPETAPRAGDGLLRLDGTGHVVYASPNALSAFRRLGVPGDLLGVHLGSTVAALVSAPGQLDEPRGSAALAAAVRLREPREAEVEAQGATVLMRVMPLVPGGKPRGALVLVRDVTELRRRDRQIIGKDATIREIHHRVKNNLQTVAALLRLQARRLQDPSARAALEESVRRVASIAMVHETLSLSLDEWVAFDDIADRVLAMCAEVSVPEAAVVIRRHGEVGALAAAVATPLAMVLTELVQNAVEHAFPAQTGRIDVRVRREAEVLHVVVEDDGRGLPEGFDLAASTRLGLQIVRTLVESELRGTIALRPRQEGGTEAVVTFPLRAELP